MKKKTSLIIGLCIIIPLLFIIIIGFFYTPYDTEAMDSSLMFADISFEHIMGCDNFGRDIFSRIVVGSQTTIIVALATLAIGVSVGIIIGVISGYFGGIVDDVLMRIMDVLFAFPSILLALVIVGIIGASKHTIIIALGIAFVPSFARIVRGEFKRCKNLDYVINARLAGASNLRIMVFHIFPNTIAVLVPAMMIGFNNAILAEAGMSYLGMGVQPPNPSLGLMLSEAQAHIFTMPTYALFPGIVILLLVLGCSLVADGLQKEDRG